MEARVFVFPTSAVKINDKKINYFEFIGSLENEDCNKALLRVFPKINIDKQKTINIVNVFFKIFIYKSLLAFCIP